MGLGITMRLLVFINLFYLIRGGLFPTVCVDNVTSSGVCCPSPDDGSMPCGSPSRGECLPLPTQPNGTPDLNRPLYNDLKDDDRFQWPIRFFSHACKCKDNFYGPDCSQCKFGYKGENCQEKERRKIRKNLDTMTKAQKDNFIRTLNKIKFAPSGWSAMHINREDGVDAMATKKVTFHPLTMYDAHVYRHVYAARRSVFPDGTCFKQGNDVNNHRIDWAHFGPGFAPWHRLWLLLVERDLQKVSGDGDMTIPYWDWTDSGVTCPTSICNPDFMGEMDQNTHEVINSPINDWNCMCQSPTKDLCDFCDPSRQFMKIKRNPGGSGLTTSTPDLDQVKYLMGLTEYDTPPYNHLDVNSFSAILDSTLLSVPGYNHKTLHAQVHSFFNGTMSDGLAITPNDPVFLVHHAQVDRLYEAWMDKYRPSTESFPSWDAALGHAAKDPLVPYFPPEKVVDYFHLADHYGYQYDNINVMSRMTSAETEAIKLSQQSVPKSAEGTSDGITSAAKSPRFNSTIMIPAILILAVVAFGVILIITKYKVKKSGDLKVASHKSVFYGSIDNAL